MPESIIGIAHRLDADRMQRVGDVEQNPVTGARARGKAKDKLERMGRLFWFTVEFGVIRQKGEIKLYGSGLISSHGESTKLVEGMRSGHGPE